jgi:hypothetical protein
MSEHDSESTYPLPKYFPRWWFKLKRKCPECSRLTEMRDNTYGSRAMTQFGRKNEIECCLCGKKYVWRWIGMGHFGAYYGWRDPNSTERG